MTNQALALEEVRRILAPLKVYTIERILGVGGAGYVLQVRHRVFGLRAMKFLLAKHLTDENIRRRFDAEALVMHRLTHPNLVKVHDLGEVDGCPYIVMDLLPGGSLDDHLTAFGAMPPKQAVRVAVAMLRGLQAAHEEGIVHRDIKPQNILFGSDGTPKVTDFGIARLEEDATRLTREGWTVGTPAYMAPEQLYGRDDLVGSPTDVHAAGVTLYEMLTRGPLGKKMAFHRQLEEDPGRLDGVPDVLQMVIRVATAQEPANRYESAEAMAQELESYLVEGLDADPPDTPELGSAPSVKRETAVPAPHVADVPALRVADVQATRAQPGYEERVSPDGLSVAGRVSLSVIPSAGVEALSESHLPILPMGTIMPHPAQREEGEREVAQIRAAAKRRFFMIAVPVGLALLVGLMAIVRLIVRPSATDATIQTVDDAGPSPTIESTPEPPADALASLHVDPVEDPAPAPTSESAVHEQHIPSSTPAPRSSPEPVEAIAAVETPTPMPAPETSAVPRGLVRLTLVDATQATVILTGDVGTHILARGLNEIPQGVYDYRVELPDLPNQTGSIEIGSRTATIECDGRFAGCRWLP